MRSSFGKAAIFNVLGRRIAEIVLENGTHDIDLLRYYASGRYFIVMDTPAYTAVSSVIMLDGQVIGTGATQIKYSLFPVRPNMGKHLSNHYRLKAVMSGYEDLDLIFDILTDFKDFDDILRMNRVPRMAVDLPDTLWNGIYLNQFIENDDIGLWSTASEAATVKDGYIRRNENGPDGINNFDLTYRDSINLDLQISFDKKLYQGEWENRALVIVIENLGIAGNSQLEFAFQMFHDQVISILADAFRADPVILNGMTLEEIIDEYGEPWQIEEMVKVSSPFYDRILILSDSLAGHEVVLDSLISVAGEGFLVDLIFSLHGSSDCVTFFDGCIEISRFTQELKTWGIPVRVLYQTCCNGADMVDEWEAVGACAVNGAVALNSLVIFSPVYFLRYWTTGLPFGEAVRYAYQAELDTLMGFKDDIPIIVFLLNEEVVNQSQQVIGGTRPNLYWLQD